MTKSRWPGRPAGTHIYHRVSTGGPSRQGTKDNEIEEEDEEEDDKNDTNDPLFELFITREEEGDAIIVKS